MQKLICLQAYSSNLRQMPGELFSYPLTPVQIPGHSHCPVPSSEPSLLQPFASTESNNPQTEILREITLPMNFEGFIMEENVRAWALCGKGRRAQNGNYMADDHSFSQGCLYRMEELSALPQPFATLSLSSCPNQRNMYIKWYMTPLKLNRCSSAQRLTTL